MIMVLLGGTKDAQERIVDDLMLCFKSRIQRLNVSHISSDKQRVRRLSVEIHAPHKPRQITLVTGVKTAAEVTLLRNAGAVIAHIYGPLSRIYKEIVIDHADLHVTPLAPRIAVPPHVLTPEEAISKIHYRQRKKHQPRNKSACAA